MRVLMIASAFGAALVLQACSAGEEQSAEAPAEAAAPAGAGSAMPTAEGAAQGAQAEGGPYSTTGQITTVEGQAVTINHQPVEGLGWPAMTMSFQAPDPAMIQNLEAGTSVQFSFRKQGEQYVLTEIRRRQ